MVRKYRENEKLSGIAVNTPKSHKEYESKVFRKVQAKGQSNTGYEKSKSPNAQQENEIFNSHGSLPALEANQINIDSIQQMNMSVDNPQQSQNIYSDRNFADPKKQGKNSSNLQMRSNRQTNQRRDSVNQESVES